jgi:hypothetical protein
MKSKKDGLSSLRFVDLRKIPHLQLARLIMQRLWWLFDSGGISHGRAERAALLEAALFYLPDKERNDGIGTDDLVKEADDREPFPQLPVPDSKALEAYSDEAFVALVMAKLLETHYGRDPTQELDTGGFVSLVERAYVVAVADLLSARQYAEAVSKATRHYYPQELIAEGQRRFRQIRQSPRVVL